MKINVSRRFRKLIPGIDDFSGELRARAGKLSLVCIGRTVQENGTKGKIYHEDGVYDFAYMAPANNGYCFAEVLKADGAREKVKLSYSESGILIPDDELTLSIQHNGSLRKPHNYVSTRKVLEVIAGEETECEPLLTPILVNDNKPADNRIYSTRRIKSCNGIGYDAQIINSSGEAEMIKFTYDTVAGILVPDTKFPSGLFPPKIY